MRGLACLALLLGLWISVGATPDYLKAFQAAYSRPDADCKTCHTQPPKRNPFGQSVEKLLNASSDGELNKPMLASIESEDADGDGASNGDEIKAKTNPGDVASKPVASGSKSPDGEKSELIPKHTFHPAITHFPIALFVFGALFGVLAKRKRDDRYQFASEISVGWGALLSIASIITGVIAWLRLGYALEGNLLFHLILASLSSVLAMVAYASRKKASYLPITIVSALLIMIAGHFGGLMVYGG